MAEDTEMKLQTTSGQERYVYPAGIVRLIRFVWVLASTVEFFLLFRLLLKLFRANPNDPFASFIYTVSDALLIPFQNLVANINIGRYVLEGKTLIAILAFMALTSLLVSLVRAIAIRR